MARPIRQGLSYFPHDVDMTADPKVAYLQAVHGLIGYSVYNQLLERIYKEGGYYCTFKEKDIILFVNGKKIDPETPLTVDKFKEILKTCFEENLFDLKKYQEHGILTSKRILYTYLEVAKRRGGIILDPNFTPVTKTALMSTINGVNVTFIGINVDNKRVNSQIPTIKEKKRKENKRRGKKTDVSEWDYQQAKEFWIPRAKKNFRTVKIDLEKFAKTIRDMRVLDKLTKDEILLIQWYLEKPRGRFNWFVNIQRPKTLRDYDKKGNLKKWEYVLRSAKEEKKSKDWESWI